jgi:hypothetical protein
MNIEEIVMESGEIGTLLVSEVFPYHVMQANLAYR